MFHDHSRERGSMPALWITGISAACVLALTAAWARWDYKQWLRLGKGGLPSTGRGWLRVTRMRLQSRNPFDLAHLETHHEDGSAAAMLGVLPLRETKRPRVGAHPVPHRQLDQHISPELFAALQQLFDAEVSAHSGSVEYALSFFEKHTLAVTCRAPVAGAVLDGADAEIAHMHAHDGSMHMVLSPAAAVSSVRSGWAELHGLAGKAMRLPPTYVMVYAPQTHTDLATIRTLLRAAIAFRTRPEETAPQPSAAMDRSLRSTHNADAIAAAQSGL